MADEPLTALQRRVRNGAYMCMYDTNVPTQHMRHANLGSQPNEPNPTKPSPSPSIQLGACRDEWGSPILTETKARVRSAAQGPGRSKVPHVQLGAPTSLLASNPCCHPRFPWLSGTQSLSVGLLGPATHAHMYMPCTCTWFSSGVSVCTCTACLPLSASLPSTSHTPDSPRWGHPMSWMLSPGSRLSSRP